MADDRILIVDDEETLREALRFNLEVEGYRVETAASAEEALQQPLEETGLILLDVMMDGMSGFELARLLRSRPETRHIPIIFLTAKDTEDDMVRGLNIGADDYIAKPFSLRNVLARIRTVLRRAATPAPAPETEAPRLVVCEGIEIDTASVAVRIDGQPVDMPRKEYELLLLLAAHRGRIFSRGEILGRVWGQDVVVTDRTIDVNITRLRHKLGRYGSHIVTRQGYGYGFR